MGFEEKIVMYRKAANMTQESLAERCNVTRQAVAKWEKGESLPDIYLIARMASMFGVSIEDLIWSKDAVTIENRKCYVREARDCDKKDFLLIMREHRFLGGFLRRLDEDEIETDDFFWNEHMENGKIFIVRKKEDDAFVGYVYVEDLNTNAPQLTMQFYEQSQFSGADFSLIRDLLNWISKEYEVRAVQAFVNSAIERNLFAYFGYKDVKDEVMLALPV